MIDVDRVESCALRLQRQIRTLAEETGTTYEQCLEALGCIVRGELSWEGLMYHFGIGKYDGCDTDEEVMAAITGWGCPD